MAANKFNKIIYSLILVLICVNFSYAAYPGFEFSESSYPTGQVDVLAKSSAGTRVDFFINNNFIGTENVFADNINVMLDGSSIKNEIVNIYSTITFQNTDPGKIYKINISNGPYKELSWGQSLEFKPSVVESITYRDEEEGISKTINVVDDLVEFEFTNVNSYLNNGDNEFKFVQKYPTPSFSEQLESVHTVSFEKFSNSISLNEFVNTTNQRTIKLSGTVMDSSHPLHYLLNIDPKDVANAAALQDVDMISGVFNVSVSNLKEGLNEIYFVTTSPSNSDIFTGQERIRVIVDTQDPKIDIASAVFTYDGEEKSANLNSGSVFINGRSLELFIFSDAHLMNYTFNDKNYSEEVEGGNVTIDLNLEEGQNNLTLKAIDLAGNVFKEQHNIFYSGKKPEIDRDSLKPSTMFKEGVVHFFFQDIEGKTNRPNMDITIFTIDGDAKTLSGGSVSCSQYKEMFVRNLGQLDRDRVDGPEYNPEELQISLTNFMFQKTTVKTDSNGKFEAMIGLQEKDLDRGDIRNDDKNPPKVGDVTSRNKICFVMQDQYGYIEVHEERVDLDAGNTMWNPEEISTIPNTMYPADIEIAGAEREGTGNAEFGMVARFSYVGPGKVKTLTAFRIGIDKSVSTEGVDFKIDTGRVNYRLDKNTGELIVYAPVIVYPMDIKPLDYPDSLVFGFEARPTYTVGDKDIPIDEKNPIYFKTSINIERPLDHTKWLTPKMIEKTQKFLNTTIKYTKKASEYMQYAAIGGVLTCTGAKFYYGALMGTATTAEQKAEYERQLYLICDRVACTAAPQKCEGEIGKFPGAGEKNPSGVVDTGGKNVLTGNELGAAGEVVDENGQKLQTFNNGVNLGGRCDTNGDTPGGDGVYISGEATTYDRTAGTWISSKQSSEYIKGRCIPAEYSSPDAKVPDKIDLKGAGGACFSTQSPYYDDTRCNFFGMESGEEGAGWDPADNIIESIRCGCITDTYSHLKNYLVIQEGIYKCLEQAKIGDIKGSYCERLMGQAVCDIATNVIFNSLSQKSTRGNSGGEEVDREVGLVDAIRGAQDGDKLINDRYQGSNLKLAGLSSDQIVNKACLGAITGDWSVLTDNILSSIEQNEVEPMFGPMIPESRMQGYNPMTGDLSIRYMFTYSGVSGGQSIRTKVTFLCDPSAPNGQYCPSTGLITSETESPEISVKTLTISKGGTRQSSVIVTDPKARYWYNVLRLEHEYELKGKKQVEVREEKIIHKSEIFGSCSFSAAASVTGAKGGFTCDTLFNEGAQLSMYTIRDIGLVPSVQNVFYPGNNIYVDLDYDVRAQGGTQNSFALVYKAICQGKEGKVEKVDKVAIDPSTRLSASQKGIDPLGALNTGDLGNAVYDTYSALGGRVVVPITDLIPDQLGGVQNTESYVYEYELPEDKDLLNKEIKGGDYGYILRFRTAEKEKTASFKVVDYEGFKLDSAGGIPSHISGDLNINDQMPHDERYDSYIETFDNDKVKVIVEGEDYQNLIVSIVKVKDDGSEVALISSFGPAKKYDLVDNQEYSGPLQEGSCEIKFRLLPSADSGVTVQNFDTYLPGGANTDDIEVSDNLDIVNMKSLRFNLLKKPASTVSFFGVASPYSGQGYCYEDLYSKGSIDGSAIYQSSDNSMPPNLKVDYRISTMLASDDLAGATVPIDKNSEGISKFNMNLDKSLLENLFKNNNRVEAVVSIDIVAEAKDSEGNIENVKKSVEPRNIVISKCDGGNVEEKVPEDDGSSKPESVSGQLTT